MKERRRILAFYRCCSIYCHLPILVDVESWDVRAGCDTKWKGWLCMGSCILFVAHTIYQALSLLHILFFSKGGAPLHQIMFHFVVACSAGTIAYWRCLLYIKCANVNAGFVQTTLTGSFTTSKRQVESILLFCSLLDFQSDSCQFQAYNSGLELAWMTLEETELGPQQRLWQRYPQNLAAILLPYVFPVGVMIIGACILYDPTRKMLLYAALPTQCQNWVTFWLCFVEEIRLLCMFIGIGVPAWQCQLIAFDLIHNKLDNTIARATRAQ